MNRDTKIVAAIVAVVPLTILSAAILCTWAISAGASMSWRLLFRVMCHGMVTRCLTLFGVAMPICARCLGIYAGLVLGFALFPLVSGMRERLMRMAMFAAAVPMAIDGLTQATGLRESTNALRLATGITAAVFFGLWVLSAIESREAQVFPAP